VSQYQKGKTDLDFTEAKDSEWQGHQLDHMQVCNSLQTDNHASTPPLKFFTGRMPFLPPNQLRQGTEETDTVRHTTVIYSNFHGKLFGGFGFWVLEVLVEICPLPLLWLLAFTTTCTTIQATIILGTFKSLVPRLTYSVSSPGL